ncbi:MAG TPA: hypothetical protein VHL58_11425 [Thermoanaerobaculia bacterium]|nr:hypothetical protein [Thermoanaerobaculia bacterium]
MGKFDWRDYVIRALLLASGGLSAVLLTLNGSPQAVPALAIGAVLGTMWVAGLEPGGH